MSEWLSQSLDRERREWQARFGGSKFLPQRLPDGTYTPGIGHTGLPWPEGRGHDWCWDPYNCISCSCSSKGPGSCHNNLAYIEDQRPSVDSASLLAEVERLRAALSAIIDGIETHDSPDGICRWNRWEHDAVAVARAALTDD